MRPGELGSMSHRHQRATTDMHATREHAQQQQHQHRFLVRSSLPGSLRIVDDVDPTVSNVVPMMTTLPTPATTYDSAAEAAEAAETSEAGNPVYHSASVASFGSESESPW